MQKINIGLVGYGGIGRVHAAAYRAIPFHYGLNADSINIVGVATTRIETAKQAAAEIGCDVFTTDYRDLLARHDIDAIDICTPNNSHHEIVQAAAAAGKHIYCEKAIGDERRRSAQHVTGRRRRRCQNADDLQLPVLSGYCARQTANR